MHLRIRNFCHVGVVFSGSVEFVLSNQSGRVSRFDALHVAPEWNQMDFIIAMPNALTIETRPI